MSGDLEVLRDVSERLTQAEIPFMVTGSMALNFYARPRMTRDIDIVIELGTQDVERLERALESAYFIDRQSVLAALRLGPKIFNIIHEAYVMKVDLIVRQDSVYGREAFARRWFHNLFETTVPVIAPEDLVLAKLSWARESVSEVQLGDVRSILRGVSDLDMEYIEKWVARLRLSALWGRVKP